MPIKVIIVQPVIPHYRVPLFKALAESAEFAVTVAASRTVPGTPDSVQGLPRWADLEHPCTTYFGEQVVFWQRGLRLPEDMGPGDVLVVCGNPRYFSNVPLLLAAYRRGVGTVWWGHYWSPTSVAWRASIRHALMRLATVTMLYTEDEAQRLKGNEPHRRRPVLGINNTIDTEPSRSAAAQWSSARLDEFRKTHGLEDKRLLLFCGRLRSNPSTELEVALRAFAKLYRQDSSWRFAIVGAGEEEQKLRAVERELGISSGLLWPGAIYDEASLAPWFLCASYFVYPGPIGLGLLHAFSYGLPVITNADRALHSPEIAALRDGENGLTFKRGDWNDLADKLLAATADPDSRQRMSAEALRTATTTFGFDGMVERFSNALRLASKISLESAKK